MRVVFSYYSLAGTLRTREWNSIVDINLSMYDEVMISTMSTPEFTVSLFCEPSSDDDTANDVVYWWREYSANVSRDELNNLKIQVFDRLGVLIADGYLFEYKERRTEKVIDFVCRSGFALGLDNYTDGKKSGEQTTLNESGSSSDGVFIEMFKDWFSDIWTKVMGAVEYDVEHCLFENLSKILKTITRGYRIVNPPYHIKIKYSFEGKKYEFLKMLSQILNAKIIYSVVEQKYLIFPFEMFSSDTDVVGYVKSKMWDYKAQTLDDFTHFYEVLWIRSNGAVVNNPTNVFKKALKDRLSRVKYYTSYEVWGYANQMLYSGQMITLPDRIDYYIQDIRYEVETLDSINSTKKTNPYQLGLILFIIVCNSKWLHVYNGEIFLI